MNISMKSWWSANTYVFASIFWFLNFLNQKGIRKSAQKRPFFLFFYSNFYFPLVFSRPPPPPPSPKPEELKIFRSSLFAGFSILNKCGLNLVKKFLWNHWLMRTLMHLATILKMSVVKGVSQNMLNTGEVQRLAGLANQAKRKHFALNCRERVFADNSPRRIFCLIPRKMFSLKLSV